MTAKRILIMSDVHIPFQNESSVAAAIKHGQKLKVDTVILNGDIIDFHSLSRFECNPKARNLRDEIEQTRKFLARLRKAFPKARIAFKQGNHESRLMKYVWAKADQFSDMPELSLESLLQFKTYGIEYSPESEVIRLGDLSVIHGQEIRGTLSTYPARTAFNAAKSSVLFGHCHRQSSYVTRDLNGTVYRSYSTGCMCNLAPDYAPHNEWTTGFALVCVKRGVATVNLVSL
jgi:predicted phosphodiesterase